VQSENPEISEYVTLARVVKTQGRRGEVAAEVYSTVPDRFALGMKLWASPERAFSGDARRTLEIEEFWPHKEWLIFKFAGVDSISDAELIVGCELQVPENQRAELQEGWSFVSDLVGCTLMDQGREIGQVEDVQFGAGEAPLLIVADGGKRFDVPFAQAFIESVDLAHKQLRMKLPEGLLSVNAPVTDEEKRTQAQATRKKC
jgi:16S rRNA processing protein RimM